jgi:hypothetical protein
MNHHVGLTPFVADDPSVDSKLVQRIAILEQNSQHNSQLLHMVFPIPRFILPFEPFLIRMSRYVLFMNQLQLQHNSSSTLSRSTQQDEELMRLNYRNEVILSESEKLREALQRTHQELGNIF